MKVKWVSLAVMILFFSLIAEVSSGVYKEDIGCDDKYCARTGTMIPESDCVGAFVCKVKKESDLIIRCENPDIVFKEDKNHYMQQTTCDALKGLAVDVMHEWPGVKLRVTEGWCTSGHASTSRHYMGWAVDLTTSDRDQSKYRRLAALATKYLDWVWAHGSSKTSCGNHVHASIKGLNPESKDCIEAPKEKYIVSVTHNIVGDEIDITVRIRNPTGEEIKVRAYVLRGADKKVMEYEPDWGWESIQPGEETTITLTSSDDPMWDVHSLGGSYRIQIKNSSEVELDLSDRIYLSTVPIGVYPEECVCDCNGLILHLVSQEGFCELTCARACGAHTNCPTEEQPDCDKCCGDWCSGKGNECVEACMERCQMTSGIDDLIKAIKSAVIIIAAIIFALCSIQYMIAGNPESRNWAKKCITYVIIGLIIIGLALLIVELFGGMVEPSGDKCVRDESCDELCGREGYSNDAGATCYSNDDCTLKCSGKCVPRESCNKECGGVGYSNDEGRTCYKDETCSIICPELPEFNGPVPFDDRCTVWVCVDATIYNYCEVWERTDTGWVCTNQGSTGSFCREWNEEGNGWRCVDAKTNPLYESCEEWYKTSVGWSCHDETAFNYCEVWKLKAFENGWGWECTNFGSLGSYCERWEQSESKDEWVCTNGGYLQESCREWRCGSGEGDVKIKIVVEDESTSNP